MGRIVCFGDSNTYGYDPVSLRYGSENRWPDLLAAMQEKEVVNMGQNGRTIPAAYFAERLAEEVQHDDTLLIMLGSNDLLLEGKPAVAAAASMQTFLAALLGAFAARPGAAKAGPEIILITPPPVKRGFWVTEDSVVEESYKLGNLYEQLADEQDIGFADAGKWGVDMTFDGVHFTEEGHHAFAAGIYNRLITGI